MADGSSPPTLATWLESRLRLVGGAAVAGAAGGALAVPAWRLYAGDGTAVTTVFAVGALLLGFGLLGWSGSVFAGRGIENMQTYMGTSTGWTEADSRRAMARLLGFGLGVMIVAPVSGSVFP